MLLFIIFTIIVALLVPFMSFYRILLPNSPFSPIVIGVIGGVPLFSVSLFYFLTNS